MKKIKTLTYALIIICFWSRTGCTQVNPEDTGGLNAITEVPPDNRIDPSQAPDSSFIYDTSINEITSTPLVYDNQIIQITGEVVGDRRKSEFDDKHYWITLQQKNANSTSQVSIYVTDATISLIDTYGVYGKRGTTLSIRGTFHMNCPEHDGMSEIHAESSSRIKAGYAGIKNINYNQLTIGGILVILGIILGLLYKYLSGKKLNTTDSQKL